jgi:acyl carrier protein
MNATADQIIALVHASGVTADVSGLRSDTPLRDAGVDSLDMMNVFLAVEEAFGIRIPDADTERLHSVDDFVRYLQGR